MQHIIHSPFVIYLLAILVVICLLTLVWGFEQRNKLRSFIRYARHQNSRYDKYISGAVDHLLETGEDEYGDALDGNLKILLRK